MLQLLIKNVKVTGQSLALTCRVSEGSADYGARVATLSAVDVLRIRDNVSLTRKEKLKALKALVLAQAQGWRLAETQEALTQVGSFLIGKSFDFERAPLPEVLPAEPPEEPPDEPMMAMAVEPAAPNLGDRLRGAFSNLRNRLA